MPRCPSHIISQKMCRLLLLHPRNNDGKVDQHDAYDDVDDDNCFDVADTHDEDGKEVAILRM